MLSDEFSMDRMNNGDSDGFFSRRLVCRYSNSFYNWTDSWLSITINNVSCFSSCVDLLIWHGTRGTVAYHVIRRGWNHQPLTNNCNPLTTTVCNSHLNHLTCRIYSLVVNTNSKYTSHFGSSWNRLLFGWMWTVCSLETISNNIITISTPP